MPKPLRSERPALRVKFPFSVLCVICGSFSQPGRELSINMSRTVSMTSAPRVLEDTQDMELLAIRTPGEIAQAQTPGDPEADENSIPCFRSCSLATLFPLR